MILIIQIPNLQIFKDNFTNYKEVIIEKHIVLHVSTELFMQQCFNWANRKKVMKLAQIIGNYKILQIEQI